MWHVRIATKEKLIRRYYDGSSKVRPGDLLIIHKGSGHGDGECHVFRDNYRMFISIPTNRALQTLLSISEAYPNDRAIKEIVLSMYRDMDKESGVDVMKKGVEAIKKVVHGV